MPRDLRRQVLALRPNAECITTRWAGLIVYDGKEMLAFEDDPVYRADQAWYRAFQYLMARFRAGALRP